jgi:hypothetical protein
MSKLFLIPLLFIPAFLTAQDLRFNYSDKISPDSLKKSVYILASDSMEGRETGMPGQKRAADFISKKYQMLGLVPAGHLLNNVLKAPVEDRFKLTPYLQNHPISIKSNKSKNLTVNGEEFLFGIDFIYPDIFNDTSIFLNEFTFITIGKKLKFRDYIFKEQFNNKPLIIYDVNEPPSSYILKKDSIAENENSPSIIFIVTTKQKIIERLSGGFKISSTLKFPVIFISQEVAEKILDKESFSKIASKSKRRKKFTVIPESGAISTELVSNTNELRGQNVVAYLPGFDKSEETIVISSHYDHLGKNDSAIYHGADDNASGTSAVMEIARLFTSAKNEGHGPRRNILFLNVSGEEKRLLGSAWYTSYPSLPIKKTVTNLNIDMIGRTDIRHDSMDIKNYVYIIGADKMSTELSSINEKQNSDGPKLELDYKYNSEDDPNKYYRRSDHYNFVKKGVPVIFYFDGNHADYHKPTDTADKIDYELLAKRTRLIFLTAWELANRDKKVVIDKN